VKPSFQLLGIPYFVCLYSPNIPKVQYYLRLKLFLIPPIFLSQIHAVTGHTSFFAFFWFAEAMNLAIQYTVTCTTMENLGLECSDRSGQRAQLGAVFFSWVCLVFWLLTTYWAYGKLQSAPSTGHSDDHYQRQHDEIGDHTEHPIATEGLGETPGLEGQQPLPQVAQTGEIPQSTDHPTTGP